MFLGFFFVKKFAMLVVLSGRLGGVLLLVHSVAFRCQLKRSKKRYVRRGTFFSLTTFFCDHVLGMDPQDSEGQTALSYAATCEHEEVARKLLEAGADPSVSDKEGCTPYGLRPKTWTWFPLETGKLRE